MGDKLTYKNWGHIHPEFTHKSVEKLLKKHGFIVQRRTYSEHTLYQVANFLTYFLPKEIIGFVFKAKADQYTDRAMIVNMNKKKSFDIMIYVRKWWLQFARIMFFIPEYEIEVLKKFPFTAWKAHFLATMDNK